MGPAYVSSSMKILRRISFLFVLFLVPVSIAQRSSYGAGNELHSKIRQLLDLYARKDVSGVMKLFADGNVLVMGSDLREVCTTREQAAELFRADFKLWDSSSFGNLGEIYSQANGDMVTAFFDVPFTFLRGETKQSAVVRFATVWKKSPQGLRMVQSMNTTPTVGQSAKELSTPRP
jgi:ketosteroid isomerase-like protein